MVEPGESPLEAAVREVREETGLTVELGDIRGAVGGADYVIEYPNGDVVAAVTTVYDATSSPESSVPTAARSTRLAGSTKPTSKRST